MSEPTTAGRPRRLLADPLMPAVGLAVMVAGALTVSVAAGGGEGLSWWLLLGLAAGYAVSGSV